MKPPPFLLRKAIKIKPHKYKVGVYLLLDKEEVVYVGSSQDFETRIETHRTNNKKVFDSYIFLPCKKELLIKAETKLVTRFFPKYNKSLPSYAWHVTIGIIKRKTGLYQRHIRQSLEEAGVLPIAIWQGKPLYLFEQVLPVFPALGGAK